MHGSNITDRLPGIIAIHDDICVFGATGEEHDTYLLHLMKTISKNGLVFNSHKCSIRQPQITFHGAIFTAQGMKPDPTKIQALQYLPTPENYLKPFYILQMQHSRNLNNGYVTHYFKQPLHILTAQSPW